MFLDGLLLLPSFVLRSCFFLKNAKVIISIDVCGHVNMI